jgi:hypothetical protein
MGTKRKIYARFFKVKRNFIITQLQILMENIRQKGRDEEMQKMDTVFPKD